MPTGINFSTIPSVRSTPDEQLAEQTNICWRATAEADSITNQPLRADVVQEELRGPDFRVTVDEQGITNIIASRWPVTQCLGGQIAAATSFQNISWSQLAANQFRPAYGLQTLGSSASPDASASGAQFIEMQPGYLTWFAGRNAFRLQLAYLSGWPHTSLTSAATVGQTTLSVDDVTAWQGAIGQIYDGGETESITVESVTADQGMTVFGTDVATGPGTVTLTSALGYDHPEGVLVTALPYNIIWATALLCVMQAMARGATATVVPSLASPAGASPSASISMRAQSHTDGIRAEALGILQKYQRIL